MLTALVTGGAGFIGSHLVERLARTDYRVVVVDRLLWGPSRIAHLLSTARVHLEDGDIRDEPFMAHVAGLGPFDAVYHLAALHYIPYCAAHPVEALSVNVLGTQVLLEVLKTAPPRCFVFASTGDVYAPKDSAHEESDAIEPGSFYGMTKMFGERQIAEASQRMPTGFIVARLFNAVGPGETNPHLIPAIVEQLKHGSHVAIGNAWPRRDYICVADIVEALVALAAQPMTGGVEAFNVGSGESHSVDDVITALEEVLKMRIQVVTDPQRVRPVERKNLLANVQKLRSQVDWQPRFGLSDTLKEICVQERLIEGSGTP